MSFSATSWAWEAQVSSAPEKLLLLCLADCHNGETGRCYPSVAYLSKTTGMDRKTVMRCVKRLEDQGLIGVQRSHGGGNQYVLKTSTKNGTALQPKTSTQFGTSSSETGTKFPENRSQNWDTNLEEPISNSKTKKIEPNGNSKTKKTVLPKAFDVSDNVRKWAGMKGFDRLDQHLEFFIGYVTANGKTYANWDQAFMNCIRGNWARLPDKKNTNEDYL